MRELARVRAGFEGRSGRVAPDSRPNALSAPQTYTILNQINVDIVV